MSEQLPLTERTAQRLADALERLAAVLEEQQPDPVTFPLGPILPKGRGRTDARRRR